MFGNDAFGKWIKGNKLDHMVRSHQVCMDGFQVSSTSGLFCEDLIQQQVINDMERSQL